MEEFTPAKFSLRGRGILCEIMHGTINEEKGVDKAYNSTWCVPIEPEGEEELVAIELG